MKHILKLLFVTILFLGQQTLTCSEASRQEYLELAKKYPRLISSQGDASKGEIEIILDSKKIEAIEKATGREVGVMQKDRYWLWVNDACLFPNGKEGVYGRILWVGSLVSSPSVAVMPILPDGRIALTCCFRHATRSWEIELPSGLVEPGERSEDAARREVLEETGMVVDHIEFLGGVTPDSGVETSVVPIFAAQVLSQEEPQLEDSEAIEQTLALTVEEIQKAFKEGFYKIDFRGEKKEVFFRDPFLSYALLIYLQGQ